MERKSSMSYVTTTSGPVVPAKNKSIKMMKNVIASMQSKYKKGEPGVVWGDLASEFNKSVKPTYVTIKDVLKKAMTESVSNAHGHSLFRLDLGNVVMDGAHAKFVITRNDKKVLTELLYPNDNGNITLRFNVDNEAMKMYEISLDSEYYLNDFGNTIKMCCDDCIKEVSSMKEEDDLYGDVDEFAPMMACDMRTLNDVCALVESEFGAEDFASDTTEETADEQPEAPDGAGLPSDPMGTGESSEEVEEGDTFRNYAANFRTIKGDNPELDCMNRIIACKQATEENVSSSPVKQSAATLYNGNPGTKVYLFADTINIFMKYYPTLDNVTIPNDVLEAIGKWLAENKSVDTADAEFEEWARMSPSVSKYVISDANSNTLDNEYPESIDDLSAPEVEEPVNEQESYLNDGSTDAMMSGAEDFATSDVGPGNESFDDASAVGSIAEDTDSELTGLQ